jgi:hypothetical protein
MYIHIYVRGPYPTREHERTALCKVLSSRFGLTIESRVCWIGPHLVREPIEIVTVHGGSKTIHQRIADCVQVWHQWRIEAEFDPKSLRSQQASVEVVGQGATPEWVSALVAREVGG